MPLSRFNDRSRKEVMSKSGFLTYRQGLILTVPGSRQKTYREGMRAAPVIIDRLSKVLLGYLQTGEMLFRELVLTNLILAAYMTYAVATRLPSAISAAFTLRDVSLGKAAKRSIDVVGSLIGMIVLAPVFLLVAIAIKLDSAGPVLFTQMRVGMNRRKSAVRNGNCTFVNERRKRDRRRKELYGRPFKVYKFRSMVDNAEKKSGPIWATANDPRITRVGSVLRKTRLDEIPQLLNVLKGDMSLVGPRPERPMFIESLSRDISDYPKRLDVKPGITGLAQVITGYDTSISSVRAKVKQDLRYIHSWTLLQDVKILLKTVIVVITGKGAF
jgi:lipopolysaccharide/colanic/teichoic acid biosynthesis glycosyltransferase